MYVCSCFGITEDQVREHAAAGACTPRRIASVCKAGTDCGSCVRRIQGLLSREACPRPGLAGGVGVGASLAAVAAAAAPGPAAAKGNALSPAPAA